LNEKVKFMHQLVNKTKRNGLQDRSLKSLEAEYHQNQQRMRQIDRRNQELAEQIRRLQEQPEHFSPKVAPISQARKPKSLLRRYKDLRQSLRGMQWGKYSLEFWMQASLLAVGIALVCGTISFMITRLIATLLGG
jgi:chromosome segregation ATPase